MKLGKQFDSAIIGWAYSAWNREVNEDEGVPVYDIDKLEGLLRRLHPGSDINNLMEDLGAMFEEKEHPFFVDTRKSVLRLEIKAANKPGCNTSNW